MTGPGIYDAFTQGRTDAARYYDSLAARTASSMHLPPSQMQTTPGLMPIPEAPAAALPDTELLGQARAYGLQPEQASQMSRTELVRFIESMRSQVQSQVGHVEGAVVSMLQGPARFATNFGQAITGGLMNLPLVGEHFARSKAIQDADMWFNELEENVRAHTPAQTEWWGSVAGVGGHIAALWYPGNAAWKVAGAAGKLVPFGGRVTSPILRTAAQGGASAWLLEGGSEHPWLAVGAGVALGPLAAEPVQQALLGRMQAVGAAAERVASKFGGTWERWVGRADETLVAPAQDPWEIPAGVRGTAQGERSELLDQLRREAADQSLPPEQRQSAMALIEELTAPRGGAAAAIPDTPMTDLSDMEIPLLSRPIPSEAPPAGMTTDDAAAASAQMTKQQIIIDSPQLSRAAGLAQVDEVTVAQAAWNSNPGGLNTIPGVTDPATFLQNLQANWPEMPHVAFARRGNRLDAIMSDQPITPRMVETYEATGFYAGQAAKTSRGQQVWIENVDPEAGMARVRPLYGKGKVRTVPVQKLMPDAISPGRVEVPEAWDAFKLYQRQRAWAAADAVGGLSPERVEKIAQENMPAYIEDFLDGLPMAQDPGQRARVRQYFNEKFIEEYTSLAPEEMALRESIEDALEVAQLENTLTGRTAPAAEALRELGEVRGVTVIQTGPSEYAIVDAVGEALPGGPTRLEFASREAAEEWLRNTPRELPDITPGTDVPLEVAGALPTISKLDPVLRPDREDEVAREALEDLAQTLRSEGDELAPQVEALAADAGGVGMVPPGATPAPAGAADTPGPARTTREIIDDTWNYVFSRWQPMRARFLEIDRRLRAVGQDLGIYMDWNNVKTAMDQNHNWQHPWLERWRGIMAQFEPTDLRSGLITTLYEMDDDAARIAAAQAAGLNQRQIQALDEMNQFFRDLFPETGLDASREIKRYISHVRKREMAGAGRAAYEDYPMNPVVEAFYEHVRQGGMQMREMDARQLGNIYVRALGFQKFMAEPWGAAVAKWNDLAQIPEFEGLAPVMQNWLKLVRTGYSPQMDASLDAVHASLKVLFPGISKDQARQLFNSGLSTTHAALLGFRPDVMARDMMQLFLATPRTGHRQMARALSEYLNGSDEQKAALYELGTRHGWVVLGKPRIAAPGVFEQGAGIAPDIDRAAAGLAPEAAAGPSTGGLWPVVRAGERLLDVVPPALRNIEGSALHPLHFYTKQGERMRLVTGLAQFRKAEEALGQFRAGELDLDGLMGRSGARTFDEPIKERFQQLVAAGQDEEAAAFLARELTDLTMFRYGTVENPEIARTLAGRIGMQMGSFSTQFYQYAKEMLLRGNVEDKARAAVTYGAVTAALAYAKETTGWDFSKWYAHNSLGFTGGPWLRNAVDTWRGMSAAAQMAQGRDSNYLQNEGARLEMGLQGVGRMLNPVGGAMRTASAIRAGLQSGNPVAGVTRALVVGEQAGDTRGWTNQDLLAPMYPQAQPLPPSPVRTAPIGAPLPQQGVPTVGYPHSAVTMAVPPTYEDSVATITGRPSAVIREPLPPGVLGAFNGRRIADTVWINSATPEAEQRGTLSHEFAHRMVGHEGRNALVQAWLRGSAGKPVPHYYASTGPDEHFAEAFRQAIGYLNGEIQLPLEELERQIPGTIALTQELRYSVFGQGVRDGEHPFSSPTPPPTSAAPWGQVQTPTALRQMPLFHPGGGGAF